MEDVALRPAAGGESCEVGFFKLYHKSGLVVCFNHKLVKSTERLQLQFYENLPLIVLDLTAIIILNLNLVNRDLANKIIASRRRVYVYWQRE